MAMTAEFSNALRSTFMFSKSGGKCTDVQFIIWKKGSLRILTASHTALLCGSPSNPPTLQTHSVVKCDQRDEERLLFHIVHPTTAGKMGGKGTGHCPSDGTWLGRDPWWCYRLMQLRIQVNDGFH